MIPVMWFDHTDHHTADHGTTVDDRCRQYIQPPPDLTDVHITILVLEGNLVENAATAMRKILLKDAGSDFYLLLIREPLESGL